MTARIFCKTGELRGNGFAIGDEATVGSGRENTIVLASATISRHHARISHDAEREQYLIEDLGSRNGTRVNGEPVHQPERLDDLSVITFAKAHDFIFQRLREDQLSAAIEAAPPAAAPGSPGIYLEVELLDGARARFDLIEGPNAIGRSRSCEVTIDNGQLSRRHALLIVTEGKVVVRDLQTTNHTYVDDKKISGEAAVGAGADLRFGPVRARLRWEE